MRVEDLIAELLLIDPNYNVRIGKGTEAHLIDEVETDYSGGVVTLWVKEEGK